MAHLAESLPWTTLASKFVYKQESKACNYVIQLEAQMEPGLGSTIIDFAQVFHDTIMEHITRQQVGSEAEFDSRPRPSQVIDKAAERQMRESIKYAWSRYPDHPNSDHDWRDMRRLYHWCDCCCPLHEHDTRFAGHVTCNHGLDEDDLEAWIATFECSSCCKFYGLARINIMIKVLLLHDHLKPLFGLTRYPQVQLDKLYEWELRDNVVTGWRHVMRSALFPYVVLNILHTKPESWPSTSQSGNGIAQDYRLTFMYQRMLFKCTTTLPYDVHTMPHRMFFGIPRGALHPSSKRGLPVWDCKKYYPTPLGQVNLNHLVDEEMRGIHLATTEDLRAITMILHAKGLPLEIVTQIMGLADLDYPKSRLKVPGDPFHPENRSDLKEYLAYCWRLMCSCGLLARWCGKDINWDVEVRLCIHTLFFDSLGQGYYPHMWKPGEGSTWGNTVGSFTRFILPNDEDLAV